MGPCERTTLEDSSMVHRDVIVPIGFVNVMLLVLPADWVPLCEATEICLERPKLGVVLWDGLRRNEFPAEGLGIWACICADGSAGLGVAEGPFPASNMIAWAWSKKLKT